MNCTASLCVYTSSHIQYNLIYHICAQNRASSICFLFDAFFRLNFSSISLVLLTFTLNNEIDSAAKSSKSYFRIKNRLSIIQYIL